TVKSQPESQRRAHLRSGLEVPVNKEGATQSPVTATAASLRDEIQDAIAAIFLAIGIVRVFGIALHRPLYGYANNFDFYRLAQWHGISAVPGRSLEAHPESPLSRYYLDGPRVPGDAYLSSDVPFLDLAVHLQRIIQRDGTFDLHWLGLVR